MLKVIIRMTGRGNIQLLARTVLCLGILVCAHSASAEDSRFYSLSSTGYGAARGNNFLVLRPGEQGNTANSVSTTTLRPHVVRPQEAEASPSSYRVEKPNPAPGTFYSLKRYQPTRRSYLINTSNQAFALPPRGAFAAATPKAEKTRELASNAPYNPGFYGMAYAGGTEQSWPIASAQQRISSGFGMRNHPVTGRNAFHKGVDIAAATGTGVLASADGIVEETGQDGLIGKFVKLRHTDGSQSLYGHLSYIGVKQGEWLKRQQELGKVGSTGRTTGPHLHYALNVNNQAVNPMDYLTPPDRQLAAR